MIEKNFPRYVAQIKFIQTMDLINTFIGGGHGKPEETARLDANKTNILLWR